MARVRPTTVCWRESAGIRRVLAERRRVGADCTARGKAGSVRGEVLLSVALAQIGKPSISSGSEETTRERGAGRGIVDLYIYIYMCTKNLAGGCDFEAAFVESRIQGFIADIARMLRGCGPRSQPGNRRRETARDQGGQPGGPARVAMQQPHICR